MIVFKDSSRGRCWSIAAAPSPRRIVSSSGKKLSKAAKGLFDESLALFRRTLRVWSREESPYQWALAKKRLGNFWLLLPTKDPVVKVNNLRNARNNYVDATRVFNKRAYQLEYAQVLYNLGDLHLTWASVDPGRAKTHCLNAIKNCQQAITRLTRDHREDWGKAQYNLAEAYLMLPGATDHQIRLAIKALSEEVLLVYPRDFIETEWADTHLRLADAYEKLAQRRAEELQWRDRAVASLKAAASIADTDHSNFAEYGRRLGRLQSWYARHHPDGERRFEQIKPALSSP